jgi:hypothetical protein
VPWHATDETILEATGVNYGELARHVIVDGKQMQLYALVPEAEQALSEVEEALKGLGSVEEAMEAGARRIISERSESGWYPEPQGGMPSPTGKVEAEREEEGPELASEPDESEEADDEDGLAPGRSGWTPEGWPTRAQAERGEERAGWTAAKIHLDKMWRGVWLSGQADDAEVRTTAQERFRDRIQPPIDVSQEGPREWRIIRSELVDRSVRGEVAITDGDRTKMVSLSARVTERALYVTVAHAFGIAVGGFTLSFDGNTAYPRDMTEVSNIRIHRLEGADDGSCIPIVFTRAGERHTQAIPRDITEPHLHEIIRRMFGLKDGEYSVRYGGGGPFRVQPQMSITIGQLTKFHSCRLAFTSKTRKCKNASSLILLKNQRPWN